VVASKLTKAWCQLPHQKIDKGNKVRNHVRPSELVIKER
jgi:hypothetical protein